MKTQLFLILFLSPLLGEEIEQVKKESIAESDIRLHYIKALEIPEACVFAPPSGWLAADPEKFPDNVQAMVIGKGKGHYPPSMYLWIEPYDGTLKGYIKQIQKINEDQLAQFKDLGQISTETGNAALCQVDMKNEWGDVRLLHAVVVRYGSVYILTAAALKDEFPDYYKDFFRSIRSMKINPDVFEQVKSLNKRAKLQAEVNRLKGEWIKLKEKEQLSSTELFNQETFQEQNWKPFLNFLSKELNEMGDGWQNHLIDKIKKELSSQK
jgi:hypothetical protein